MDWENWYGFSLLTILSWGFWGFLSKITADLANPRLGLLLEIAGTLIIGIAILFLLKFKPQYNLKGVVFAVFSGIFSIGGILLFLFALKRGKAVIIVPMTALYPAVTVILSKIFVGENINRKQSLGIITAIIAAMLLGM